MRTRFLAFASIVCSAALLAACGGGGGGPAPSPNPPPSLPPATSQTCDLEGTVTQRVSLQLQLRCTDSEGAATEQTLGFAYDPAYAADSSLEAIAGIYTLSVNSETNSLTINANGVVFGLFHNGPRCTVNGQVDVIDPDFNLYSFELLFSDCQVFQQYEGRTMTGLGALNLPGTPQGSFLLLITGVLNDRLEFFSILYQPA